MSPVKLVGKTAAFGSGLKAVQFRLGVSIGRHEVKTSNYPGSGIHLLIADSRNFR